MKIIEKVLCDSQKDERIKQKIMKCIIENLCPSNFGLKNINMEDCNCAISTCIECWNREYKEKQE